MSTFALFRRTEQTKEKTNIQISKTMETNEKRMMPIELGVSMPLNRKFYHSFCRIYYFPRFSLLNKFLFSRIFFIIHKLFSKVIKHRKSIELCEQVCIIIRYFIYIYFPAVIYSIHVCVNFPFSILNISFWLMMIVRSKMAF